jgi:hypothetical protein
VDIGRRNLTAAQVQFLEGHLLALGDSVIVIEEIRQPCFHICVRKPQFRIPLAPLPPEMFENKAFVISGGDYEGSNKTSKTVEVEVPHT